ncbi:asparagine synthetase B family protein, partial [Shimia litoralis]
MCGLIFALAARPVREFVTAAHARQYYRGPDGEGVLFEETAGVHLGMAHQRLAIVGLSESGAQPMLSASGRYRILFNGEVYNFRELADQFGLTGLRSGTDTEVIVELIERLGIDEAFRQFNGMWAMVVQDCVSNRFYVARDRFGKKPLYMYRDSNGIYMASEMHSLMALPGVDVTPDPVTAARFLSQSLQSIDDHSWLELVEAFPAASIAEIDGTAPANGLSNLRAYWKPGYQDELPISSEGEAIEELRHLVQDAIRLRLHADVPVGVALSGGIDSSIIAAQAKHQTSALDQMTELFSAVKPFQMIKFRTMRDAIDADGRQL